MSRFPHKYFHGFWKQMYNVSWKTLLTARSCPAEVKQSSWALGFPRAGLFQLNSGAVRGAGCPELFNKLLQRSPGFRTMSCNTTESDSNQTMASLCGPISLVRIWHISKWHWARTCSWELELLPALLQHHSVPGTVWGLKALLPPEGS